MHADPLVQPQDHGEEECDDDAAGDCGLERAGEQRAHRSTKDCSKKPWKPMSEDAPGGCAPQMGEPKPKRFEYLIRLSSDVLLSFLEHFGGEQADIDNADNMTVGINNREGEEFVENEELARVENSRRCWNRDDASHHQLAKYHIG